MYLPISKYPELLKTISMNFISCCFSFYLNLSIMKKLIFSIAVSGILLLVFQSFIFKPVPAADIPADVQVILKTSCYDCHSNDGSNKKATIALNFDKWDGFKDSKKVSKMEAICEVLKEGKMPPEKYLGRNPDKAPTDDQKKVVCNWAEETSAKLMEGN